MVALMSILALLSSPDPVCGAVVATIEHELYPLSTAAQATITPSGQRQSSLGDLATADEVVPHHPGESALVSHT